MGAALIGTVILAASFWQSALPAVEPPPRPMPLAVPVMVQPAFVRIEVPAGSVRRFDLRVTAPPSTTIVALTMDCPCLRVETSTPVVVGPAGVATVTLTATGVLPGIKTIGIETTAGRATASVQVVTPGLGNGLDAFRLAQGRAGQLHGDLWVVAWNLRGEVRNCGCSSGSLGGLDHLVALPAMAGSATGAVATRFLLAGDTDGGRPDFTATVIRAGWARDERSVCVGTVAELDKATVVITEGRDGPAHARLVRPLLDRGQTLIGLVMVNGQVADRIDIPVDQSLPSDRSVLVGFIEPTVAVETGVSPSASCIGCHAAAGKAWQVSRHARALASLPHADQTQTCITCHTTPASVVEVNGTPVANVHCQSCHQGGQAHAVAPAMVRTLGAVDCRSCHDSKHNPGFDALAAWLRIAHGR